MKHWVIIESAKGAPAKQIGSFPTEDAAIVECNRLRIANRNRVAMDEPFLEVTYRIKEMTVKDADK